METKDERPNSETPPDMRAADVQRAAGLSYRQLNDWDSKGAVPGAREAEGKWRKFTPRAVFTLMVCAALRRQFGAPVEGLKFIQEFMMQEGANHLAAAVRIMKYGARVWLLTDCKQTFVMDHDIEFADMFELGAFRGEREGGYYLLPIDPIVKRLVAAMKDPIDLAPVMDLYAVVAQGRSILGEHNEREREVLGLLRDPANEGVNITVRDGQVVKASARKAKYAQPGRELTEAEVLAMLRSGDYQTVTVKKHGGKYVSAESNTPIPMKDQADRPELGRPTSTRRNKAERRGGTRKHRTT
jgi:DNA-binding transcriptional MerR regulator